MITAVRKKDSVSDLVISSCTLFCIFSFQRIRLEFTYVKGGRAFETNRCVSYFFPQCKLSWLNFFSFFSRQVPAGLFVPCILCGSAFGRLIGEGVQSWADDDSIRPGTYALIGATAMLGGVTRMTISLTVILLETTNNIKYLLPIMIVLMIAKFVGDCFNISLYDMHVELNALPFVESHPPQDLSKLCAVVRI